MIDRGRLLHFVPVARLFIAAQHCRHLSQVGFDASRTMGSSRSSRITFAGCYAARLRLEFLG
jgi:hypothetical protein